MNQDSNILLSVQRVFIAYFILWRFVLCQGCPWVAV